MYSYNAWIGVIGHIQQRNLRNGKLVFEIVASEVDFLRDIEWQTGERVREDLVKLGIPKWQAQGGAGGKSP